MTYPEDPIAVRTNLSGKLETVDRELDYGDELLVIVRARTRHLGGDDTDAGVVAVRNLRIIEAFEVPGALPLEDGVIDGPTLLRSLKRRYQSAQDTLAGKAPVPGLDPEVTGEGGSWLVTYVECGHDVILPEAFWQADLREPGVGWLEQPVPLGTGSSGRCALCGWGAGERVVADVNRAPGDAPRAEPAPDADHALWAWLALGVQVNKLRRDIAEGDARTGAAAQSELDALFAEANDLDGGESVTGDGTITDAEGFYSREAIELPDFAIEQPELDPATAPVDTADVSNVAQFDGSSVRLPWDGYDTSTVDKIVADLETMLATRSAQDCADLLTHVEAFETRHRARKGLLAKLSKMAPAPLLPDGPSPDGGGVEVPDGEEDLALEDDD